MTERDLESLRERIRDLDLELVRHAAERVKLVRQVGEIKHRLNLSTVDYAQERIVMERARADAERLGLDPAVAEELIARLIRASVAAQDEERMRVAAVGAGQSAVVVG